MKIEGFERRHEVSNVAARRPAIDPERALKIDPMNGR